MERAMIRYKVKPECAGENEKSIREVFAQLGTENPAGLRYLSFKLGDGLTFVHIVSREDGAGGNPLMELPAFQAFAAGVKERCSEPPVATELCWIGTYGFNDSRR